MPASRRRWSRRRAPPGGVEVIVGLVRDPRFGHVVMVGLGGVFVEVLRDVAFRLAPITRADALDMLAELRGARLLDGVRGGRPVDRAALADLLLKVAGPDGLWRATTPRLTPRPPLPRAGEGEPADRAAPPAKRGRGRGWGPQIVGGGRCDQARAIEELDSESGLRLPGRRDDRRRADRLRICRSPADRSPTAGALAETMRAVFAPRSVAVVGASTDDLKLGARAVKHLVDFGYPGDLYPIHPSAAEIYGRAAYPSLAAVPGEVERAIVTIAAEAIPAVIDECVAKGVKVAHIYTAGFGEVSEAGRDLERDILARAAAGGVRIDRPELDRHLRTSQRPLDDRRRRATGRPRLGTSRRAVA